MTHNFILDAIEKLPTYTSIKKIVDKLKNYQVYLTGGCIRDILAKRKVKDIDFATSATPDIVADIFENTLDIGKKFGTITVLLDNYSFEITTFRKDFNYDGRHPSGVEFGDLKTDAMRRDFTCNALYFDLSKQKLVDHVRGLDSIKSRIITAVGDPLDRFREDKLRMLRAVRFVSELGWEIDNKTYEAIKILSSDIDIISKPRWQTEFDKIILSSNPIKGLKMLLYTKLLQNYLLSDLKELEQKINALTNLYGSYEARLAALLYTSDKQKLEQFFVNKKNLNAVLDICKILKKDIMSLELCELREINENPNIIDALKSENRTYEINKLEQTSKKYPSLPPPLIDGNDIKTKIPNKHIGKILKIIRKMQLNELIKNKTQALEKIKELEINGF